MMVDFKVFIIIIIITIKKKKNHYNQSSKTASHLIERLRPRPIFEKKN